MKGQDSGPEARQAREITITGLVQGIGFRPGVVRLAKRFNISGTVRNTESGVLVHAEGFENDLAAFAAAIPRSVSPLAQVTGIAALPAAFDGFRDFTILESRDRGPLRTLIPPDLPTCPECMAELFDRENRRYLYPFINCTYCGPRYSIIKTLPYDRPKTSMEIFPLCPACRAEYEDPEDRRFHAEPNACPVCGPRLAFRDAEGRPVATDDPVGAAATVLKAGKIVAVKGIGGFHLCVDAENEEAVSRLRDKKYRGDKPLAVMARNLDAIRIFAEFSDKEEQALLSAARPILLLRKKEPFLLAEDVSTGLASVGTMLPYAPVHHLLFSRGFRAVVMTSANRSGEPLCIGNEEALARLSGVADGFLVHDRDIRVRCDDSVSHLVAGKARTMRRGRGLSPAPIRLSCETPQILACGAQEKNSICLTRGKDAFVSQHIGDLDDFATYGYFTTAVTHLGSILGLSPELVACDLHPDYGSTRYARQSGLPALAVQHHHAHIASVAAEHRLSGPLLGIALDGAGLGTDRTVWGGEVLLVEGARFTRLGHLSPVPLPGGDAAAREPWRMAASHLFTRYGTSFLDHDGLPLFTLAPVEKVSALCRMMARGLNAPPTSSMGRLFDAVAALVGLRGTCTYEGQAAMELEALAGVQDAAPYGFLLEKGDGLGISCGPLIEGVLRDLAAGVSAGTIAARFHETLVQTFTAVCRELGKKTGVWQVALSGGVFQNRRLLGGLFAALSREGFSVYANEQVPANDGGISLGQAWVAALS
ncbi:MAG: carbamoyltransferase HypF [Thermodesulfobacteriota bacterium]